MCDENSSPAMTEHYCVGEISYDLVMDDDSEFSEGTYRVDGGEWRIVIVSKKPIESCFSKTSTWESGVSGIVVHVPLSMRLNMESIENLLSEILGVRLWKRVKGPDSMQLR